MEEPDPLSREIEEVLRTARMTAEEVALAAGLARDAVGRWIRSSTVPRLDSLRKVEGALGKRLGYAVDLSAAVADRKERTERRHAPARDRRRGRVQPGQPIDEWDPVALGVETATGSDPLPEQESSRDGYPVVGEAAYLEARVHRAVVHLPYIRRDVEGEVRSRLVSGRPVLLVGPSMVGKTRMAATLIKEMFATRQLLVPDSKDALASLDTPAMKLQECVIFLDDIERLIGPGGITQAALHQLGERNVLVGTIRALIYNKYQPTDRLRPFEWDVLSVFERVFVFRTFSSAEQGRLLEAVDDAAVRDRISRTGVGEYVGAADRISEALALGSSVSPVGLALVHGAADWARAGMSTPTPAPLLPILAAPHMDPRNRLGLTKREIQAALRWATRAINPTVSLLQREPHDAFSVYEYALDLISGQDEPIPETTWPVLIQHASPVDLMNIGRTASAASRPEIAEQAWRRTEDTGDSEIAPMAGLFLGAQLREQGDLEGAVAAYQRAIASGHEVAAPGALFNLGNLLKQQGDLAGAKDAYQRAVDSRHPRVVAMAAVSLGRLHARNGDMTGAREAYQRAIDSDFDVQKLEAELRSRLAERADAQARPVHLEVIDLRRWRADPKAVAVAALNLGELLAEQGDVSGARAAFKRAIDSGDADIGPKAASSLGIMLHQGGDVEGARTAYQYAADAGHLEASPLAAFNLGILLAEDGDVDGALNAYRRAADFGNVEIIRDAMLRTLGLGILLAEKSDLNGAKAAYRHAIDFGQPEMAPWTMMKLAMALNQHGGAQTAYAALQSAVNSRHPPVVAVAWLGLGNLLASRGDVEAARTAFQHAIESEYPQVVAVASLGLGWLLTDTGDVKAARAAFQRAIHSEYAKIAEEAARNLRALP